MKKDLWDISKLHEWDKNPRSITKDGFNRLKKHISDHGQMQPLVITKQGEVLGGNMRLKAYREMGIDRVWVEMVDPRDEAEKLRIALVLNDRSGFYDDDLLANLSSFYPDFNWEDYSVDLKEPMNLKDLLDQFREVVEDEAPEVAEGEAVSKYGEVHQLGRHRLMCGDSMKSEDTEKLMNGVYSDMVFTDPPYNVNYGGNQSPVSKQGIKKIENDNLSESEWEVFCEDTALAIEELNRGPIYVCHAPGPDGRVMARELDKRFHWSATIVWKKDRLIPGRGHFQRQYEPIWYGWKGDHREQKDRTATDVWEIDRGFSNDKHPTMKPISLITRAIGYSSFERQNILDLFGGSGSTLIACEQTNRTCYMMEIDPKYCDVIRKRYANFIGKGEEWQTITPRINR